MDQLLVYLFWVLFHHYQGIDYISPTLILGVTCLGVKKYVAKIGCGNEPSLALFRKLGFVEVSLKRFCPIHDNEIRFFL